MRCSPWLVQYRSQTVLVLTSIMRFKATFPKRSNLHKGTHACHGVVCQPSHATAASPTHHTQKGCGTRARIVGLALAGGLGGLLGANEKEERNSSVDVVHQTKHEETSFGTPVRGCVKRHHDDSASPVVDGRVHEKRPQTIGPAMRGQRRSDDETRWCRSGGCGSGQSP